MPVTELYKHEKFKHTYGECTSCGELEFATLINGDGGVLGFQCLHCKAVGMFPVARELHFEAEGLNGVFNGQGEDNKP